MRIRSHYRLNGGVAALALGAALALAGCNRANETTTVDQTAAAAASLPDLPATLPLSAGPATDAGYAPDPDALPDVAPIRTVRVADPGRNYAYADSAYDFADALGDAPPDYAFDYDGVDPWAWQGYDDSTVFAEPLDDGYRYYYYRAGADQPYFVRDPDYGYGYDDGNLAVVYASDGAVVPWADYGPRVVYASRYLSRGRDLWRASRARRAPVIAANWDRRRPAILQSRRAWAEARVQQPGWAAYRNRYGREARDYWQPEAQRRVADARRYAAWQARDYRSAPPPRAIPATWQRASWARDERRYAPVREERRGVLPGRDERFEAQRRQAIAAREQALAARQAREPGDRMRPAAAADREQARAAQEAQRDRAQQQRQAQLAARQQREQARSVQQTQGGDIGGDRQARLAERQQRQQARAAQQAQRAQADRGRQAQQAARQQREQAQAARQAQRAGAERDRPAERAERQQRAQAQAARQAERADRQPDRAAQVAERQQRDAARAAQQAQAAERQQRDAARAAQQAQREQAQQARQQQVAQREQQRQAQAVQRAQRDQAQAAQAAQRAQADQARAARQQEQAARQQQRAERAPRGAERQR